MELMNFSEHNSSYQLLDTNNLSALTNTNSKRFEDMPVPPNYIIVGSTVLYCAIFLIGVVGNLTVVFVISCSRRLKKAVNMYLVNLCVADLLVLLLCMPTALTDLFAKDAWYFGAFMCKFVPFMEHSVANASVLTIIAISVERYKVIRFPLKSIDEKTKNILRIIAIIWIISMITSSPWLTIAIHRNSTYVDGTPIMVCRAPIAKPWQIGYVVLLTSVFFIVPAIMLFAMNCHMYRMLRDTCSQAQNIGNGYNQSRKRQRQVANNIFSIVSIFFVCHLPYRATSMYLTFVDRRVVGQLGLERYLLILYSARICFYINHAINPLIYNFVSTKFRRAFINVCCSSSRCKFVSERGERRNSSSLREQKYTFKTGTATPNQIDSHF